MKLNPDCIREILFAVEAQTGFLKPTYAYDVVELVDFPEEEVLYHINQCELYGFFTKVTHYVNQDYNSKIMDLSPKGHEFIQNIRSQSVWGKTKELAKSAGSFAIGILADTAISVVKARLSID